MTTSLKFIFLFFFLSNLADAQAFKWAKDKIGSILADTASPEKVRLIAYPTIAYTPETRWEFGISALLVYHAAKDTTNRLSEINAFTFVTLERQYGLWLDHALYTDKNEWFFLGSLRWQCFPLRYYGIGPSTPNEYAAVVESNSLVWRERILKKVIPSVYAGLEFDYQRLGAVRFVPTDETIILPLPPGSEGGSNLGLGFGIVYDNRHNLLNVRQGFFGELAYLRYNLFSEAGRHFDKTSLDLRYYHTTFKNQVLAFQFLGISTAGPVPYNLMAEMGGEVIMRGYYRGRYRDNSFAAMQAEYRWLPFSFSKRFGAAVFTSYGNVGENISNLTDTSWKWGAGGGIRFLLFPRKDIYTRLDFAWTRESSGIYFFIGESF